MDGQINEWMDGHNMDERTSSGFTLNNLYNVMFDKICLLDATVKSNNPIFVYLIGNDIGQCKRNTRFARQLTDWYNYGC